MSQPLTRKRNACAVVRPQAGHGREGSPFAAEICGAPACKILDPISSQSCPGRSAAWSAAEWCAADPGPLRAVAVPDQQCTVSLPLALHRIRDTYSPALTINAAPYR